MDVPVSTYLPRLAGSRGGTVTLHELVTHTAGYAEFGPATKRHAAWTAPFGQNFINTDLDTMTEEVRGDRLATRGTWRYSSLGAAVAGQAVAAAAGMSYPDLMRTRLFEPLGMAHTDIQTDHVLVTGGTSQTGGQPPTRLATPSPGTPDRPAGTPPTSVSTGPTTAPSSSCPTSRPRSRPTSARASSPSSVVTRPEGRVSRAIGSSRDRTRPRRWRSAGGVRAGRARSAGPASPILTALVTLAGNGGSPDRGALPAAAAHSDMRARVARQM